FSTLLIPATEVRVLLGVMSFPFLAGTCVVVYVRQHYHVQILMWQGVPDHRGSPISNAHTLASAVFVMGIAFTLLCFMHLFALIYPKEPANAVKSATDTPATDNDRAWKVTSALDLGNRSLEAGNFKDAIRQFSEVIDLDPTNAVAHFRRG